MAGIQFIATSPNALAELIADELRRELKNHAQTLAQASENAKGKEVMTRKETAEFFGVTFTTIHDWVQKGILHPYKVGNRVFFKRSHLMEVLEQSNPERP